MADPDTDPNAGPDDLEDDAQPPAPLPLPHVGDPDSLLRRNVPVSRQTPRTDELDPRAPSAPVPAKPPVAGPEPEALP